MSIVFSSFSMLMSVFLLFVKLSLIAVSFAFSASLACLFLCVFRCFDKWSERVNRLPHSLQANLFSPVWVRRWRWSSSDRVKDLLQNSQLHTKGRNPACHLKWALRWLVLPYTFPQPGMWHICCFGLFGSVCWPEIQLGHLQRRHLRVTAAFNWAAEIAGADVPRV